MPEKNADCSIGHPEQPSYPSLAATVEEIRDVSELQNIALYVRPPRMLMILVVLHVRPMVDAS